MRSPPALTWKSNLSELEVELGIITPVFGGGAHIDPARTHQKEVDHRTPIRGSAIRGQLRFWWRAAIGCLLGSHRELLERETAIWGNASSPGAVALSVARQPAVAPRGETVYETYQANNGAYRVRPVRGAEDLAYGAFSLQPQSEHLKSNDPGLRAPGVLHTLTEPFRLTLRFPESMRQDVETALTCWTSFGGLGGRTRRGFGAIQHQASSPEEIVRRFNRTGPTLDQVPSLHGARIATLPARFPTALDALRAGLAVLRKMRQGPGYGRNPGSAHPNRPGRSRWPEPELIRKLTNQSNPQHRERLVNVDAMPRWRFGMPIVFHFQGGGDPNDTHLKPRGHERMASPLIIRPFKLANGKYGCLALVLTVPGFDVPLELALAPGTPTVRGDVTRAEVAKITPFKGHPDALTALLHAFANS